LLGCLTSCWPCLFITIDRVLQKSNQADTEFRGVRAEFRGVGRIALRAAGFAFASD
jgi:hypothetical protein